MDINLTGNMIGYFRRNTELAHRYRFMWNRIATNHNPVKADWAIAEIVFNRPDIQEWLKSSLPEQDINEFLFIKMFAESVIAALFSDNLKG